MLTLTAGDLDPSFGSNGKVVTDLGFDEPSNDFATDVAVYQTDGKFVVAGYESDAIGWWSDMVVTRYNADGSLDTTFGSGGKTRFGFGGALFERADVARSVQVDVQGRIVVAGSSDGGFAVVRLNPDGSFDTSFGSGGGVLFNLPFDGRAMALDSQGRIVLAGTMGSAAGHDLAVARLSSDGSLDSDFLFGGIQGIGWISGSDDYATSVAVDSLDRIIVGGYTDQGTNGANWDFLAARLDEDGALDVTFDGTGMTTVDLGGTDRATRLAVDSLDRVVMTGGTDSGAIGGNRYFAVVRLDVEGSPDDTFSEDGKQTIDLGTASVADIAVDARNRLVISGTVPGRFDPDFFVARLNSEGALDTTFSGDGRQTIDFGGVSADYGRAVAIDAQGRILVAGERAAGQGIAFGIARLVGTQAPVANAGGPYSGIEGSWVTLDGSASTNEDDVIVSYEWDLDYDGVTFNVDRTGVSPAIFYADNLGPRTIALRVRNSNGLSSIATTTVAVDNIRPTASVAGPASALRGQLLTFTLSGNDVSSVDYASGFRYAVNFGDGVTATIGAFNGLPGTAVTHGYGQDGTYTVSVSSIDKDGGVSDPVVTTVQVRSVAVLNDPHEVGKNSLFVVGQSTDDTIVIQSVGNTNELEVRINGESQGTYSPSSDGRIYLYGLEGEDDIQISGSVTRSAWIYGGSGNDRLKGGGGHDVLFGDEGDDALAGQSGRDFLIGGNGADRLVGNAEDDILVSGWLAYDFSPYDAAPSVNLHNAAGTIDLVDQLAFAVMREWTSERSYGERIYNISRGAQKPTEGGAYAARLNGGFFLNLSTTDDMDLSQMQTVFEDNSKDVLTGSAGLDWFLLDVQEDLATDLRHEAFADLLDWLA